MRAWVLTRADTSMMEPVSRILYRFLSCMARLIVLSGRSKDLEIIVLRHQLSVLRRQGDPPPVTDNDCERSGGLTRDCSTTRYEALVTSTRLPVPFMAWSLRCDAFRAPVGWAARLSSVGAGEPESVRVLVE
jgi:hypothetical protein